MLWEHWHPWGMMLKFLVISLVGLLVAKWWKVTVVQADPGWSIGQVDALWCPPTQSRPDIPINPQLLPRGLGWQLRSPAKFVNAFLSSVISISYLVLLYLLLLMSTVCFSLKGPPQELSQGGLGELWGCMSSLTAWIVSTWEEKLHEHSSFGFLIFLMLPSPAYTAATEPLKTIDWGNRSRTVYFSFLFHKEKKPISVSFNV